MAGWRVRGKPLTHCLHVVWKEMSAPWNRQAQDAFCSAHSLCSEEPQQHILRPQRRLSTVMAFYLSGMTERMIRNVCRVYTHYVREPRCIYLFIYFNNSIFLSLCPSFLTSFSTLPLRVSLSVLVVFLAQVFAFAVSEEDCDSYPIYRFSATAVPLIYS